MAVLYGFVRVRGRQGGGEGWEMLRRVSVAVPSRVRVFNLDLHLGLGGGGLRIGWGFGGASVLLRREYVFLTLIYRGGDGALFEGVRILP